MSPSIPTQGIALLAMLLSIGFIAEAATPNKTPPKPLETVIPTHPPELYVRGIEGEALVVFTLSPEGKVLNPKVESASHEDFGKAALEAIRQWTFTPATEDGKPVNATLKLPFKFAITFEERFNLAVGRPVYVTVEEPVHEASELKGRPRPVSRPESSYPEELKGSGKEGTVVVEFVIDKEGKVVNPKIVQASSEEFILPALAEAALTQFEPMKKDGEPVYAKISFPFRFSENPGRGDRPRRPRGGGFSGSRGGGGGGDNDY